MFEKSSVGNRSSLRDANYHQHRQALRYRSDRCNLGADRADVTGSPTRWPTTDNQHSCCVKRNLLSSTNRLPMAFASPRISSLEHGLSLLPSLEERWCLDLRPALNVPASSTASRSDRLSVGRHHVNRRLSKDYEYSVQTSETLIDIAATRLILNRLASA